MKNMAKKNTNGPSGLPLATVGSGVEKFYTRRQLYPQLAPTVTQRVRDPDAQQIQAVYHNLCQQIRDLDVHRFQGTMNEYKQKRGTWIQVSNEIHKAAKSIQERGLHTADTDAEEDGDPVIETPVTIPVRSLAQPKRRY